LIVSGNKNIHALMNVLVNLSFPTASSTSIMSHFPFLHATSSMLSCLFSSSLGNQGISQQYQLRIDGPVLPFIDRSIMQNISEVMKDRLEFSLSRKEDWSSFDSEIQEFLDKNHMRELSIGFRKNLVFESNQWKTVG